MDPRDWRNHTVKCENGVELAVYQFIPKTKPPKQAEVGEEKSDGGRMPFGRPVVLLSAGLGNTVAVYNISGSKSLPNHLSNKGCDVWAYDLRGHGKSKPPPDQPTAWNLNSYVFQDAAMAITFVCDSTGANSIHFVGHSMGGMIGMALAAHPRTTHLLKSVVALGSSIFLRNSFWWWVLYFTPMYPIFHLGGGIDMSTHLRNTNCLLQLPCVPSCGVYDSLVASSENAGSARVNKLLEECFTYEPNGVIDDLSEGMQLDGLILRPLSALPTSIMNSDGDGLTPSAGGIGKTGDRSIGRECSPATASAPVRGIGSGSSGGGSNGGTNGTGTRADQVTGVTTTKGGECMPTPLLDDILGVTAVVTPSTAGSGSRDNSSNSSRGGNSGGTSSSSSNSNTGSSSSGSSSDSSGSLPGATTASDGAADGFVHSTFGGGNMATAFFLPTATDAENQTSREVNTAWEMFHLKDHIGSQAPRILLVCATEDVVVPEADVLCTFEAIVRNSEHDPSDATNDHNNSDTEDSPADSPADTNDGAPGSAPRETSERNNRGAAKEHHAYSSRMFSVGTKAGSRVPYSHFDLVFGEDASTDVFPEVSDFIREVEYELMKK